MDSLPHEIYSILPYRFPWLSLVVATVILLVIIVVIVSYLYRRRKQQPIEVTRDIVADTKAKIINMRPCEPFDQQAQRQYFFALSISFRELIEYRCRIKAIGATIKELQPRLQLLPMPLTTIKTIVDFMTRADQIKFAGQTTNLEQAQQDHRQVVSWVKRLTVNDEVEKKCS